VWYQAAAGGQLLHVCARHGWQLQVAGCHQRLWLAARHQRQLEHVTHLLPSQGMLVIRI
jgi:hypothetical protein